VGPCPVSSILSAQGVRKGQINPTIIAALPKRTLRKLHKHPNANTYQEFLQPLGTHKRCAYSRAVQTIAGFDNWRHGWVTKPTTRISRSSTPKNALEFVRAACSPCKPSTSSTPSSAITLNLKTGSIPTLAFQDQVRTHGLRICAWFKRLQVSITGGMSG